MAGFPKDIVGFIRAWWLDADMAGNCINGSSIPVYISPSDWTQPVPTSTPVDVFVTTCAAAVDLYVNSMRQSASAHAVPRFGYASWPGVVFQPGNITAVAYDASGRVVGQSTVLTVGPALALHVWADQPTLVADGQDTALIGVAVVDASMRTVPNDDRNITFTVSGPGACVGVANGNPSDHSPARASWRVTWKGLCRALVQSAGGPGAVTVTASAPGLVSGSVTLVAAAEQYTL